MIRNLTACMLMPALLTAFGTAAAEPVGWTAELRADGHDVVVHDAVTVAGGAVVVGTLDADGSEQAGWIARLGQDGAVLWTRVFDDRFGDVSNILGMTRSEDFAFHGIAQAADGALWAVGTVALTGEMAGSYGLLVEVRPDGRLTNFYIRGNAAESLEAVAAGPDGVIAVGESRSGDSPSGWIVAATPGQGVTFDAPYAQGLPGHLADVAIAPDGRLQMLLMREPEGDRRPLVLYDLPPDPDQPMSWLDARSVGSASELGLDDGAITILGDGHGVLYVPRTLESGVAATEVAVFAADGTLTDNSLLGSGENGVAVLDAVDLDSTSLAVGLLSEGAGQPALWLGTLGPGLLDTMRQNVLAPLVPASAAASVLPDDGLALALGLDDGGARTLALTDPLDATFDPAAPPSQQVMLGDVAAFHRLCPPTLCDVTMRLPHDPDRIGEAAMPFDRSYSDQFARIDGLDFAADGTMLVAGLDGGAASRHRQPWVRAFAPDGSVLWSTPIPEGERTKPFVYDVAWLPDGRAVAVGYDIGNADVDGERERVRIALAWLLDADGTVAQTIPVDVGLDTGGHQYDNFGLHVAVPLGSTVIVAGGAGGPAADGSRNHGRGVLAAIDTEGVTAWKLLLPEAAAGPQPLVMRDVAVAPDGSLLAIGNGLRNDDIPPYAYMAAIAADGTLLRESVEDWLGGPRAQLSQVAVAGDGSSYLAGVGDLGCADASGSTAFRPWVAALDADWGVRWTRCLVDREVIALNGLVVADGRLVAAGYADAPPEAGLGDDPVGWVAAFNLQDGQLIRDAVMGAGITRERLRAIALGPDGRIWVAGRVSTFRGAEGWIARLALDALAP